MLRTIVAQREQGTRWVLSQGNFGPRSQPTREEEEEKESNDCDGEAREADLGN